MTPSSKPKRSKWDHVPIFRRPRDHTDGSEFPWYVSRPFSDRHGSPWSRVRWDDTDRDIPAHHEFVVQRNRQVRQAGATQADGQFVGELKLRAERSLYIFCKSILNRRYFIPSLHLPICNWLQTREPDPSRKMLRCFREMGKTSMIAHGVPLHIHIQPREHNLYFPGEEGCEQRILLVKETIDLAMDELRTVKGACEDNELLRALWPHRFWEEPSRQSRRWSAAALIHPRANEWPDPSLRAMGVGGAIAGKHPTAMIKDDLISFDAANSEAEMEMTINWHKASRALMNKPGCLEFILGTPWAIHDLYSYIEATDNRAAGGTVSVYDQPLVVNGVCVYPEFTVDVDGHPITYGFSDDKMEGIRTTRPQEWLLQYQITVVDPSMVDFARENLRWYHMENNMITFDEDARDAMLVDLELMKSIKRPSVVAPSQAFEEMDVQGRRRHILRARMAA